MEGRKMRIEVLVAYPPTDKCRAVLEMAREAAASDPRLRLDIYESGSPPLIKPTAGWLKPPPNADHAKFKKIPSIYVNGCPLTCGEVPSREELMRLIEEQLKQEWQE
jgi:hypothetical protein